MIRRFLLVIAVCTPFLATVLVTESLKHPRRFAVVEEGKLYRSGFPRGRQLRELEREHKIRSVLSLTDEVDKPHDQEMRSTVAVLGLAHRRIAMPGNGCGEFEDLNAAADFLADGENWPVLFHCQAGKQRSSAALAAYRLRNCGWTLTDALEELETKYELERNGDEKDLVDHLAQYFEWLKGRSSSDSQTH